MRAVLGIDAAWTATNPSGVALAIERSDGWELAAVAPSYERFFALARLSKPEQRLLGSGPSVPLLLSTSHALGDRAVDLVAVDMPLARVPITCRRVSDNLVSKAYGGRKCGTHTPNAVRPGRISDELREGFERSGYPLLTTSVTTPGLVEVYPHPALVELAGAPERLPYKVANIGKYWRSLPPVERRFRLLHEWKKIVDLLETRMKGVSLALPEAAPSASGPELKAYEDMLDAVVCAWIGICVLKGQATPFGDHDSSIWIPSPIGS